MNIVEILYMLFGYQISGILGWLEDIMTFVNVLTLIWSLVCCYFGWKIFKFCLALQGFLVGVLGGVLIAGLSGIYDVATVLLIAVGVGIVLAVLAVVLYKLGVFIFCLGTGVLLTISIGAASGAYTDFKTLLIVGAVVGVILGVIGVILTKHIVICGTAVFYGFNAGYTIGTMMTSREAVFIFGALFIITGILVQYLLERKIGKKKQPQMQPQYAVPNGYAVPPQYAQPQQFVQQPVQYAQPQQYVQQPVQYAQPQQSVQQPVQYAQPQQPTAPAAAFCPECGTKLAADDMFCPECGTKI